MNFRLRRLYPKERYTIGKLYMDGLSICDTLEDPVRDYNKDGDLEDPGEEKIYKDTAIPYGTYQVVMTYSPKFKRRLPLLLDVKHFTGIRIHAGSTAANTWGCILVGVNTSPGTLTKGRFYEDRISRAIEEAEAREETITITIT